MEVKADNQTVAATPRRSRAWVGWLLLGSLLLAVATGGALLIFGWHEPTHASKPLSHWLAELNGTNYLRREIAADALAKIGAPALDPLQHALRKERSFVFELRDKVWKIAPPRLQQHIPKPWSVEDLQFNACVAIAALGAQAESLAPDLIRVLTNNSPAIESRASFALGRIGTNAHPALLAGVHSDDPAIAKVCRVALNRAGVPLPASQLLRTRLEAFLAAQAVTERDWSGAGNLFDPPSEELNEILRGAIRSSDVSRRNRAAALYSFQNRQDEEIANILMAGLRSGTASEKPQYFFALLCQGGLMHPHRDELEQVLPSIFPNGLQVVQGMVEERCGFSTAKWNQVEALIASGDVAQQISAIDSLQITISRYHGVERALRELRGLLGGTNEAVARHVLRSSARYGHPLRPDVEQLGIRLTQRPPTDALRQQTEETMNRMTNVRAGVFIPRQTPAVPGPGDDEFGDSCEWHAGITDLSVTSQIPRVREQ